MTLEIKNWDKGEVIYSGEAETIAKLLEQAVKDGAYLYRASLDRASLDRARLVGARLDGARLDRARLVGARLDGASLFGASLDRASLVGASLDGASLDGASLFGASLDGARLDGASLDGASLDRASLVGASLVGARLDNTTTIETGETWKQYLSEVVPALLTAGGKAITDVLLPEHWKCHTWDNCPMAVAFESRGIQDVPILLKPRAEQFIRYFDAKLIPLEAVGKNS